MPSYCTSAVACPTQVTRGLVAKDPIKSRSAVPTIDLISSGSRGGGSSSRRRIKKCPRNDPCFALMNSPLPWCAFAGSKSTPVDAQLTNKRQSMPKVVSPNSLSFLTHLPTTLLYALYGSVVVTDQQSVTGNDVNLWVTLLRGTLSFCPGTAAR